MKNIVFVLLFLFISNIGVASDFQGCHSLLDDCEFYTCMETQSLCGEKGYQLSFGRKYCLKFAKKLSKFSQQGKDWIINTKKCLTEKLFENRDERSCRSIKKQAFKDHVGCYFDSGYCELSKKDKWNVIKIVGGSILRPRIIKTGLQLQNRCRKRNRSYLNLLGKNF